MFFIAVFNSSITTESNSGLSLTIPNAKKDKNPLKKLSILFESNPIAKEYDLTQVLSDKGANFKALHVMIHQVKSWIRTTYSWVSEKNIDRYFNEFCYRINRSQNKETIFNNLINRMVKSENITHQQIICS